jgi:hypothetical protein
MRNVRTGITAVPPANYNSRTKGREPEDPWPRPRYGAPTSRRSSSGAGRAQNVARGRSAKATSRLACSTTLSRSDANGCTASNVHPTHDPGNRVCRQPPVPPHQAVGQCVWIEEANVERLRHVEPLQITPQPGSPQRGSGGYHPGATVAGNTPRPIASAASPAPSPLALRGRLPRPAIRLAQRPHPASANAPSNCSAATADDRRRSEVWPRLVALEFPQ